MYHFQYKQCLAQRLQWTKIKGNLIRICIRKDELKNRRAKILCSWAPIPSSSSSHESWPHCCRKSVVVQNVNSADSTHDSCHFLSQLSAIYCTQVHNRAVSSAFVILAAAFVILWTLLGTASLFSLLFLGRFILLDQVWSDKRVEDKRETMSAVRCLLPASSLR